MSRYTRNRQLEKLGIRGYIINVPIFVMTEHHQSEHRLDASFEWRRYNMITLSVAYWKDKRFNKKKGKSNWKARKGKTTNYVSYKGENVDMFGFSHIK